jgi:hypothetical protein
VHEIDAGEHLEQFGRHVRAGADALGGKVDLARIGLGIGDQLWDRLGRESRIGGEDKGRAADAGDRLKVAAEIEIEVGIECGVDRVGRHRREQGVAVRSRMRHDFGADIARRARPVVDDELLAHGLRQRLRDEA